MKKILFLVAIILSQSVFSQQLKKQTSWNAIISVGYGDVVSGNVTNYYNKRVDAFRRNGIPIETQTKFGRTAIVNTGFIYNVLENIGAGISLGYSYSPAYSNYKDINGTIKINGSVNSFDFGLMVKYIPYKIGKFPIILRGQMGFSKTSFQVSEEIKFNDLPQNNFYEKLSKEKTGPSVQLLVGTAIDISAFSIALEGGYKFSYAQEFEYELEASANQNKLTRTIIENTPIDFGSNGFIFLLSFGLNF